MAKCEVCGNEYDKAFELITDGARHTFDSLECAIQAIAPTCEHCKCRVIGHGVEVGGGAFSAALIVRGRQRPQMSEIAQPRSSDHSKQGHRRCGLVVSWSALVRIVSPNSAVRANL